jgi:hypothetical protein
MLPVPFVLPGVAFIPLAAGRGFVDLHLSFRVSYFLLILFPTRIRQKPHSPKGYFRWEFLGWPHVHGDGDSWFYDMLPGRSGYEIAGGP